MKQIIVILITLLLSLPVEQLWGQESDNFCPRTRLMIELQLQYANCPRTRLMIELFWELQYGNSCPLTMNIPDLDSFKRDLVRFWHPRYDDDFRLNTLLMISLLWELQFDIPCPWWVSYIDFRRQRFERDTTWMMEFHYVIRRATVNCFTVSEFFEEWISLSMRDQWGRAIGALGGLPSLSLSQFPYNTPLPTAAHSLRDAPRRAWATFEGDTARYLEFNYTIRRAQYIGWTLRDFLEELELPVIGVAPVGSTGPTPLPLFMVIRHVGDTFHDLRDYYIGVRLENMPTREELARIPRSEDSVRIWGRFAPEELDFLKDLRIASVGANVVPTRDPELAERQRQWREESDWRRDDQALREYRDRQWQAQENLRQLQEQAQENLVRQQVQEIEYFLQQQEQARENLMMSQGQELVNLLTRHQQAYEYFLQQQWQEREQNQE